MRSFHPFLRLSPVLSLLVPSHAAPAPAPAPSPAPTLAPRQASSTLPPGPDYSPLLTLASLAGIPIPTDNPALLLSIAPLAAELNSALPTAPVLSVLETAVPSGFLSNIVHDPAFAASFVAGFEAGSSPSWFLAMPSSVREYLHTYNNYGGVESAAAGVESIESVVSSQSTSSVAASLSSAGLTGAGNATANATATSGANSGGSSSGTMTDSGSGAASGSAAGASAASTSGASAGQASSSSSAAAAAPKETSVLAVGAVAAAGILGLAVAL